MATDTSEKGLETLIMRHMTGVDVAARMNLPLPAEQTAGSTGSTHS